VAGKAKAGKEGRGSASTVTARRRKPSALRSKRGIYDQALSEAERLLLPEAREVEGLDEEISLLRVKLRSLLAAHPENTELMLKALGMLLRAVSTRYRLSREARENLAGAINEVLKEIGGALWPDTFPTHD